MDERAEWLGWKNIGYILACILSIGLDTKSCDGRFIIQICDIVFY